MLRQDFLLQVEPQARSGRQLDVAMLDREGADRDGVPACFKIDEVLGDEEIRYAGRHLQRRGQADGGAVIVVRGDDDEVRLRHSGDLFQLQNAAAVANVWVDDVGRLLLKNLAELGLGVKLLS